MVKKVLYMVLVLICLCACSSNEQAVSEEKKNSEVQTLRLNEITEQNNTSMLNGVSRYKDSIVIGTGNEIGSYNFNTKEYSKIMALNYGVTGDKSNDIAVTFQDDQYLVITAFQERSIDSTVLWPNHFYIIEKNNFELIHEIANPINMDENKKISGYIPLTVYKDNQLVIEVQNPESHQISLYKYSFDNNDFGELISNAANPKLYDNELFFMDISNASDGQCSIYKSNDWMSNAESRKVVLANQKLIEDYQYIGKNEILYVQGEQNSSHYNLMFNGSNVSGALVNAGMLTSSGSNAVLDYYYDNKVRVFNIDTKEEKIIAEGDFVSNITIFDNTILWQEVETNNDSKDEQNILKIYNIEN